MLASTKQLIRTLEDANRDLRSDFTKRLAEKDDVIIELRERVFMLDADNRKMLLVLLPYGTTAGAALAQQLAPKRPPLPVVGEAVPDYQTELRSGVEAETDV